MKCKVKRFGSVMNADVRLVSVRGDETNGWVGVWSVDVEGDRMEQIESTAPWNSPSPMQALENKLRFNITSGKHPRYSNPE